MSEGALDRIRRIAADAGLDPAHPPEVMAEAQALAKAPGIDDPRLLDLRRLPFCTIDEATSKDLDQALFVEESKAGWTVWYAIADAAWFARPGTALFAEALRRGATYYLPGLVIPMLPKILSEDVVSLGPDVDRRAMVFEVGIARDGEVLGTKFHRAVVRSRLKTSYDAVQAWFDGAALSGGDAAIEASLRAFRGVGEARLDRADAHHVVIIRRREIEVGLADSGFRFVAIADARNDVERWNEQISLLCNEEGAKLLREGDRPDDAVQAVYRVHGIPEIERLDALADTVARIVERRGLDPAVWGWRLGTRKASDWLAGLPEDGPEGRLALALHRQVVLAMNSASFTAEPGAHMGIGADVYARFTAPMREIVGVYVHKEAWERLGVETPTPNADDDRLREQVIEVSNAAKATQRALDGKINRLVLDQILADDLASAAPPERMGTVMGIARGAVHVLLDDPPVDVKVYLEHLQGPIKRTADRLAVVREDGGAVVCEVGDAVKVRVRGVDKERDRIALDLRRSP